MSEILKLSEFAKKGLNTDLAPWDLPPEFLTDMNNIRIINQKAVSFGGYQLWSTPPVDFEPSVLKHAGLLTAQFWWVAGKDAVYSFDGTNWIDISSTVGYSAIINKEDWTCTLFSTFTVATHPQIYPEFWTGASGATLMEPLPFDATRTFSDVDIRMDIIRSHKDFLIAWGLNEQGTELVDTIRWSTAADVGFLPATWDESDATALAGKAQLGGSGGKIIDGLPLRDAFIIYRENGISVLDYTGDIFVWRIRHLETTTGAINKDCIVEVKGKHFFIGDGDILVNDGNSIKSIMHHRIRKRFIANINIDQFQTSYALRNDLDKEVWFCVPEGQATFPNIAYIYNWRDDTWFLRDLNPEAVFTAQGPFIESSGPATLTWDTWTVTWDTAVGAWGNDIKTPLSNKLISIRESDGALLILDSDVNDNVEEYLCFIERTDIPMEGHDNVTTIQSIYPHLKSTVPVRIRLGSQKRAGGPITWKPFIDFDPNTSRKINIRTTGELHAIRVERPSSEGVWEFSGVDFEYVFAGKR